jgi:hypothetical protein
MRAKTFRVLAGILAALYVGMGGLLAFALPHPGGVLLLLAPQAVLFLQYSLVGRVTEATWIALGGCLVLLSVAWFFDSDSCLDSGGAYVDIVTGCRGGAPAAGLLLEGGGTVLLKLIALAIASGTTYLGLRLYRVAEARLQSARAA